MNKQNLFSQRYMIGKYFEFKTVQYISKVLIKKGKTDFQIYFTNKRLMKKMGLGSNNYHFPDIVVFLSDQKFFFIEVTHSSSKSKYWNTIAEWKYQVLPQFKGVLVYWKQVKGRKSYSPTFYRFADLVKAQKTELKDELTGKPYYSLNTVPQVKIGEIIDSFL